MTPTPPPSLIPAPPNFAVPEFVFPNLIPGKPRLPASFQLWPEVNPQGFPVTPPIPPTVQTGDVITASHENTVSTAISDLWIDLQSLAGIAITDPTSAKGDLIVRGISALGALTVGANGTLLTADTAAASGIRWGTPSFVPITRQVIAGAGMTGGGALSADVTLNAKVTSVNGQIGDVVLTASNISGAVPSTRQVIAGTGLTGGGPLSADVTLNVAADTTVQRIRYSYNGTLKGTRPEVNLIPGSNVTLSVADNPGTNRIDVTVAAAGGGSGGMVDPTQNLGDLIVRGTSTTVNLPVGAADGQVLTVDHLAGVGIKWAAPTAVGVPTSRKINTTLPALAGGGDLTADLTLVVMPDSIVQQTRVSYSGALVGTRRETNYIAGTGVTLTIADDTANNRVNVTIASAAVGGGPQTPWTSDINAAGFMLYSASKVGIGIATPQAPLHIVSSSVTVGQIETTAASGGVALLNLKTVNYFWQVAAGGAGSTFPGSWYVYDQTAAAVRLQINASGNVGIGTGTVGPSSLLQVGQGTPLAAAVMNVYGADRTLAQGTSHVSILSTDAMALDKGGTLALGGVGGAVNPYAFAVLAGRSENNAYAGYLQFSAMTSAGTLTERMRVTSLGAVGIGTTNPISLLSVNGPGTSNAILTVTGGSTTGINTAGIIQAITTGGESLLFGALDGGYCWMQAVRPGVSVRNLCLNPNGGGVGIGTVSPGINYAGAPAIPGLWPFLDIKTTLSASQTLLRLISAPTTAGSFFAAIEFDVNETGTPNQAFNAARIYGIFDSGSYAQGRLTFSTPTGSGTWTDVMSLKNGYVGIGITSPAYPLHVFNPAVIGAAVGSATLMTQFQYPNPNIDQLRTYGYRQVADGSWSGCAWRIQRYVDSTPMGFITYYMSNIGINKDAPAASLDVAGDVNCSGTFRVNGAPFAGGLAGIQINGGAATTGQFTYLNFFALGGILINSGGVGGPGNNTFTVQIGQSSDSQLKQNVRTLNGGLPLIARLRPITAEWNGLADTRRGERITSVIAQELQAVIPDAVYPYRAKLRPDDDKETELLGYDQMTLTCHLILAVQQLERRLKALEN